VKRFEFSLERLLSLKKQQECLAELDQQRAAQDMEAARHEVIEIEGQIVQLSQSMNATAQRGLALDCWVAGSELSEKLGVSLGVANAALRKAEEVYSEKSSARAKLATEVESLNTLRSQQWEAYRREQAQADQARLDEIGLNRWMSNQSSNREEARR
jgi:flagellar export protein FliJ